MALKLDAICAKLKLNIVASTETGISTTENNNEAKLSRYQSVLCKPLAEDSDVGQDLSSGDHRPDGSPPRKRFAAASSLHLFEESDSAAAITPPSNDNSFSVCNRRSRRKNFQPRFVQEVIEDEVREEKLMELAVVPSSNASENGVLCQPTVDMSELGRPEADNGVLDLRVGDCARVESGSGNGKATESVVEDLSVDSCGVIDLSMNKSSDKLKSSSPQVQSTSRSSCDSPRDLSAVKKESGVGIPMNNVHSEVSEYAVRTMNKLLKIYGLSEESGYPEIMNKGPPVQQLSSGAMLWPMSETAVLPRETSLSSVIPDDLKLSYSSEDLDLTKSSASPSSQSMEASAASLMDEDCSIPNLMKGLKSSRQFLPPSFSGFSSKHSLSKRSSFKQFLPDYGKYAKRYSSPDECSGSVCREKGFKEHFHCTACTSRVFPKKEEMIRHFKWHKKREDSLQHGFMRYSPLDDCSKRFSLHCSHNGKHTHYHCLQDGCSKVYISTSDVQMHANYHRKDSAIIQEGFQRFRATENCAMVACAFAGQKTTHFHCRRTGCNFTFKNKADMEKHKTYHQKDEILTRDGFKKFMKYEQCHYGGCSYSRVSNHIHCIRPGCSYVLHSTGQLYSHKRKHERREIEQAMYKQIGPAPLTNVRSTASPSDSQLPLPTTSGGQPTIVLTTSAKHQLDTGSPVKVAKVKDLPSVVKSEYFENLSGAFTGNDNGSETVEMDVEVKTEVKAEKDDDIGDSFLSAGMVNLASDLVGRDLGDSLTLPITMAPLLAMDMDSKSDEDGYGMDEASSLSAAPSLMQMPFFLPKTLPVVNEKKERDESWKRYLTRYTANDPCHARCQFLYKDHYHCNQAECGWLFRSKDGVREHAKFHEQQDRITALMFTKYDAESKCTEDCEHSGKLLHYHCLWTNCNHVISSKDSIFSRLEHHKLHESVGRKTTGPGGPSSSLNSSFKRKRGRPPKFPKSDIPVIPKVEMTEEEIHTQAELTGSSSPIANGFQKYECGQTCPDEKCIYGQLEHYHCVRPRCHHVTNRADVLALHAKDFHSFIAIADGFEFFDRNVNCRRLHCHNNQTNRHFHCIRPKCDYSFVRYSTMVQHDRKHRTVESNSAGESGTQVVKSKPSSSATIGASTILAAQTITSEPGSVNTSAPRSTATFLPVSTFVSRDGPVVISSNSVGLTPMLLTTLQPLAGLTRQTVAPIMVTHGAPGSGRELKLTSSPLKLVSIAPKPAIVTFQAPVSSTSVDLAMSQGTSQLLLSASSVVSSCAGAAPLTVLLQQKANNVPPVDWSSMQLKMHHELHQNCGRPFCKLKKKDHFHCFDCNQAFSDPARLKSHVARHGLVVETVNALKNEIISNGEMLQMREEQVIADDVETTSSLEEEEMEEENEAEAQSPEAFAKRDSDGEPKTNSTVDDAGEEGDAADDDDDDEDGEADRLVIDLSSARLEPSGKSSSSEGLPSQFSEAIGLNNSNSSSYSSLLDVATLNSNNNHSSGRKKVLSNVASVIAEDRKMMATAPGYEKFRFSEDCGQERCAYRLSMTHYHCSRADCGYSFCDHSRFLQHSDRHRRIDVIMGDQFQQFHAKTDCRQTGCEHARSATHFHCLTCPFVCTDSSKVVAHRKHHSKMDRIAEYGFLKFSLGDDCGFSTCVYRIKQTHYHCGQAGCGHVVMGPAQMGSHKVKHSGNSRYLDIPSEANFSEGFD